MILIHMHRISRNLPFLVRHQFGKFQGSSSLSSIMISRISSGASITSPVMCLAVNWNAVSQEVLYCYSTVGKRNDHRNHRNLWSPNFSDAFRRFRRAASTSVIHLKASTSGNKSALLWSSMRRPQLRGRSWVQKKQLEHKKTWGICNIM